MQILSIQTWTNESCFSMVSTTIILLVCFDAIRGQRYQQTDQSTKSDVHVLMYKKSTSSAEFLYLVHIINVKCYDFIMC